MLLDFIDGMNLAIVNSPPLRVVGIVGQLLEFVPHHWARIASTVITTSAQIGTRVLSKTLSDRYLRAANVKNFKPRGLSARLCITPAMLRLVTHDDSLPSSNGDMMDKVGRGVSTLVLKSPIPLPIVGPLAVADKPPSVAPTGYDGEQIDPNTSPVVLRRLALVQQKAPGVTLPLVTRGIPPPTQPEGMVDLINAWGVQQDAKKEGKAEKKNEEMRRAWARIQEAGVDGGDYGRAMYERETGSRSRSRSPMPMPTPMPAVSGPPSDYYYSGNVHGMYPGAAAYDGNGYGMDPRAGAYYDKHTRKQIKKEKKHMRKAAKKEGNSQRKAQHKGLLSGMSKVERKVKKADLLEHWATQQAIWIVIMPAEEDEKIKDIEIAEDPANEERIDKESWKRVMESEKREIEKHAKERYELESSDSDSED